MINSTVSINGYRIEYFATKLIHTPVDEVVIVIHGDSRTAEAQIGYVQDSNPNALVIAPRFATVEDSNTSGKHVWTDGGWKRGDQSVVGNVSSFAVVDHILKRTIASHRIVAGHSAGGQFTQRYAGGSGTANLVNRFVIANPSSYMYLNSQRPKGSEFKLLTTAEQQACPTFNHYRYGLVKRNPYMSASDLWTIRYRMSTRPLWFLLGALDTQVDSELDLSCAARWQGANRLERGLNFHAYLTRQFNASPKRLIVPSVGHSAGRMFRSPLGKTALAR